MIKCISCGQEIPKERLEIIKTDYCVKCAEKKVKRNHVEVLESSAAGRNGFARND